MKVSIIIPTYNHFSDLLRPCLESIEKYTDLKDKEIIVVSNGATDETVPYIEYKKRSGLPYKLLDFPRPIGFPKAINVGALASKGDYLILLNNDASILECTKDIWVQTLIEPFLRDLKVAVTGPAKLRNIETSRIFVTFFCAMIRRSIFEELNGLDEIFTPGVCEDVDFCCRAEDKGYKTVMVPKEEYRGFSDWNDQLRMVYFPIYHPAGSVTFESIKAHEEKRLKNIEIIYWRHSNQAKYGNNFERAVFGRNDEIRPNEHNRYKWASENILGSKILEVGCSSGVALRFIDPTKYSYLGIDYDSTIVNFATKEYGPYFKCEDINKFNFENYDTIIAFEFLEHIENGKEIAQKLKNYCRRIIATCPYKEVPGTLGKYHKLHLLDEKDFPGFKFKYYNEATQQITDAPEKGTFLMLMIWDKKE